MDRADGYWSEIVGQADAVRTLERAALGEREAGMTHAWLITGPPGSGRSNLAYRFAAALIARRPEEREAVFQQVRARTHPDLDVLTTEGVVIKLEHAREIAARAHYAPASGRFRVIVAEDADRLPARSSNALLKALEEPPERTVWILCAPSEADLLPTIRSRARSLRLVTPSTDEVARLLHERDGIDPAAAEQAARLAQSHIGMAKRLATDPAALARRAETVEVALGIETLGQAMQAANALVKVAEADAAALTAERNEIERADALRSLGVAPGAPIPQKLRGQLTALEEDQKRRGTRSLRDGLDRVFTDLLSLYRDALLIALRTDAPIVNREVRARVEELANEVSAERLLACIAAVETARHRLAHNVSPALTVEAMFATIARATRR